MKCNCKGSNRRSQLSLVPIGEESEENEILFLRGPSIHVFHFSSLISICQVVSGDFLLKYDQSETWLDPGTHAVWPIRTKEFVL